MFINATIKNNYYIYEIKDDKYFPIGDFKQELKILKLRSPAKIYIHANNEDRFDYRKNLFYLFKKINKLSDYDCYIFDTDNIEKVKNEIQ